MDWGAFFFGLHGRINRAKFWLAALVYFVVGLTLGLTELATGQGIIAHAFNFMVNLIIFISGLAVGTKRLHDREKSGWWLLLFYVVPIVMILVAIALAVSSAGTPALAFGLVALAIVVWSFVELGCLRGTIGANGFGPDPLANA